MKRVLCGLLCILLAGCTDSLRVEDLTCEYRSEPLAIEALNPALSWKIKSENRTVVQSAYQVLVADNKKDLKADNGNVWNSGKVESGQSVNIHYSGKTLEPGTCYYWKVKVWNKTDGKESGWSKPACWRQVEVNPSMSWIGYKNPEDCPNSVSSIWYRKNYKLDNVPDNPVFADVATPGYYELYINGEKVGTDVLAPSVSGKDKRTFYVTYDIRKYLQRGLNTIGIWTARGWAGVGPVPVAFRCEVPQGEKILTMQTDASWKAKTSHYATIGFWKWGNFGGECVDARKNVPDWNRLTLDDSDWESVQTMDSPSPTLVAQPCELNRRQPFESAKSITELDNHCYEIDCGKAFTGDCRIYFPKMNRGDSIVLHFADTRWNVKGKEQTPAGPISTMGIVFTYEQGKKLYRYPDYNQRSVYVASGEENEVFESKFNPLGFRYIIVEGLKKAPVKAMAALVETDLDRIGDFACSNDLLMKMHQVNDRTMRCLNQGGLYVDCPQRERLGYGDGQVSVESSMMNYYMPSFYRKFIKDWVLRQDKETGNMPHVAPNGNGGGGPAWAGLVAAMTWRNYLYYGDKDLLKEIYPAMFAYLKSLEAKSIDLIYRSEKGKWDSIGDWLAPERGMDTNNWPTPVMAEVFNNSYIVYLWDIQRKAALALGKMEDARICEQKLKQIRPLIHQAFYDEEKGYYVSDEQPYLMMPLMAGIVPDNLKESIWKKLEDNINTRQSFQTGMIGTYFMINYLMGKGRNDLLYKMVAHTNYPGWGYMLSQGATVWWEQWNGYYSQMHSVFTSLDSWFYQGIAGIQPFEENSGMKHFRIKPAYDLPLNFAKASTESMYGIIRSEWLKMENGDIQLNVEIPSNTTAEVWFPTSQKSDITEGNQDLDHIEGVEEVSIVRQNVVSKLSSGYYEFKIKSVSKVLWE